MVVSMTTALEELLAKNVPLCHVSQLDFNLGDGGESLWGC